MNTLWDALWGDQTALTIIWLALLPFVLLVAGVVTIVGRRKRTERLPTPTPSSDSGANTMERHGPGPITGVAFGLIAAVVVSVAAAGSYWIEGPSSGEANGGSRAEGEDGSAKFIGNGLVYQREFEDLYTMDEWGNDREIFLPQASDPSWSPDASQMVYSAVGGNLIVVDVDGSNPREVATGAGAYHPRWSPTDDRIVYRTGFLDDRALHLIDSDGSNNSLLVGNAEQPSWSRDGRSIVYRANARGLSIVDVETGRVRQLTDGSDADLSPDWSPTRDEIVFESLPGFEIGSPRSLFVISSDGTSKRQITFGTEDSQPRWSPDGEQIVFMDGSTREFAGTLIMVTNRDGSNRYSTGELGLWPVWSPR